jgi:dsRNA-specific ribonuclease
MFNKEKLVRTFAKSKKEAKSKACYEAFEQLQKLEKFEPYFSKIKYHQIDPTVITELHSYANKIRADVRFVDKGNATGLNLIEIEMNGKVVGIGEAATLKEAKRVAADRALKWLSEFGVEEG